MRLRSFGIGVRRRLRRYFEQRKYAGMSSEEARDAQRRARKAMGDYDTIPDEIRRAIDRCEFRIDIERLPRGFAWRKHRLIERIDGLKTHEEASEFDKWLLQVGLRSRR